MPFVLGAIAIVTAIYFIVIRARNGAEIASEVFDMANDVRLAARRFGFKRRNNIHPVETIETADIAIAGIASAFLELDDLPTKEQRNALQTELAEEFALSQKDAEEITILARWFVSECGGPAPAVSRLSRKLVRLAGQDSFAPLLSVVQKTLAASSGGLNTKQTEALDDVKRAFRL